MSHISLLYRGYGVGGEGGAGYGVVDMEVDSCMNVGVFYTFFIFYLFIFFFYTLLGLCGQWFNRCILVDSLGSLSPHHIWHNINHFV